MLLQISRRKVRLHEDKKEDDIFILSKYYFVQFSY
jgi:hypothetical protein